MKNMYFILIFLFSICLETKAQNDMYTFESITDRSGQILIKHDLKPNLANRISRSRGTVFNIIYDNPTDWNAGQKKALEYGVKLWEEQIKTCYPRINLRVKFKQLGTPLANTFLRNFTKKNKDIDVMSGALLKSWQIEAPEFLVNMGTDSLKRYFDVDDIIITFNNESELFYWGTDGNTPSDKYDFVTLVIREIAKGLGLNCTITKRGNTFLAFIDNKATLFDELMGFNPTNTPSGSTALASAAQNGQNRVVSYIDSKGIPRTLEFYAPPVFKTGVSFCYLTEESAETLDLGFFAPELPKGRSSHNISYLLGDMMDKKLGWNKPIWVGDVSSASETTYNNLIDFYDGTTFNSVTTRSIIDSISTKRNLNYYIENEADTPYTQVPQGLNYDDPKPYEYEWRLDMLKKDGKFVTIKRQTSMNPYFQIKPSDVPDNEDWARNAEGNIRARIYYKDPFSEQQYPAPIYTYIFLDYYPEQPELSASTQSSPQNRSLNPLPALMLAYRTWGATSVELIHESEDGTVYYDLTPDENIVDMSHVDPFIENTFTLIAKNKIGQKISNTVIWGGEEFMAAYYTYNRSLQINTSSNILNLQLITKDGQGNVIEDSDIKGIIKNYNIIKADNQSLSISNIAFDANIDISIRNLQKGVYIIRVFDDKGDSYVQKFVKN